MEFQEVVRKRKMVRSFQTKPVDPAVIERIMDNATRVPSAGYSQGWAYLLLDQPQDVERFWQVTWPERDNTRWPGLFNAPVVVVPFAHKQAYLDRYAEPDKGWTDKAESRWPMPYRHMDTAMASLLILQTAVDAGLGALFFGIPVERVAEVRRELVIPDTHDPIGALTIGHLTEDAGLPGSARTRHRIPLDDVVHRGGWGR